jgi:hypothetical protein
VFGGGLGADRAALVAEQTLPSVKLRGVRLVARKDLERVLCPEPQTWPDGDEEMEEEQEIIE